MKYVCFSLALFSTALLGNTVVSNSFLDLNVSAHITDYLIVSYQSHSTIPAGFSDNIKMTVIRRGASYLDGGQKNFNIVVSNVLGSDHTSMNVHFKNWNKRSSKIEPYKEGVFEFGKEVQGFKTLFGSQGEAEWINLEMMFVFEDEYKNTGGHNKSEGVFNMHVSVL